MEGIRYPKAQWSRSHKYASTPREISPVDSRLLTDNSALLAADVLEPPFNLARYLLAHEADGRPPPTWAEQVEREILEERERQRHEEGVRRVRVANRVHWDRYAWYDPTTPIEDIAVSSPREGKLASTELRRPRTPVDSAADGESAEQRESRAAQEELQVYLSEVAGNQSLSATDQADMEILEELAPVEEMVEADSAEESEPPAKKRKQKEKKSQGLKLDRQLNNESFTISLVPMPSSPPGPTKGLQACRQDDVSARRAPKLQVRLTAMMFAGLMAIPTDPTEANGRVFFRNCGRQSVDLVICPRYNEPHKQFVEQHFAHKRKYADELDRIIQESLRREELERERERWMRQDEEDRRWFQQQTERARREAEARERHSRQLEEDERHWRANAEAELRLKREKEIVDSWRMKNAAVKPTLKLSELAGKRLSYTGRA